jgi:hypothetical protein
MIIKMSHMNGTCLESTTGFGIFYERLHQLTTRLDQQIQLMNIINSITLSQSLKLYFQTFFKKIFNEKVWIQILVLRK